MKVSVSLPDDAVAFLDDQVEAGAFESRSAALSSAVRLLQSTELADEYETAFSEWADSEAAALWASTDHDGLR